MISALNRRLIEASYATWSRADADLAELRSGYDIMCPPPRTKVGAAPRQFGGVPGQFITPENPRDGLILFLHGGGFVMGSSRSHFSMAADLADTARCPLFLADYRLAPEAMFPAALDDSCAIYRAFIDEGWSPGRIAIVGDSAGGGLALSTVLALRCFGLPDPACVVTMSAWADLTCSGDSLRNKADVDPILTAAVPREYASIYLGSHPADDPRASALFGDFHGFPPLLMQVGSDEILLDDTLRIAERVRRAGGEVRLEVAEGMMHVFQMLTWLIPEANAALERAGGFIAEKLEAPAP